MRTSDLATAPLPRTLWIELTSRCPFDCVFCSRAAMRGDGEHMDLRLFSKLIGALEAPEVLRLNYSGESTHHPQFFDALRIAAATHATTELVSAFATFPLARMEDLVSSGLDRLTISLHTLDPAQWRAIYARASVEAFCERMEALLEAKRKLGSAKPRIDLAFVAMQRNLDQLERIAAFAVARGIEELAVHPLIRRDEIREAFADEVEEGRLRETFRAQLNEIVARTRRDFPTLTLSLSTPELGAAPELGETAQASAAPLPQGAHIVSCDQSPWETAHVLANGDVVPCEVQDRRVLGRLAQQPLREIWHGEAYRRFRSACASGADPICNACVYKHVVMPRETRSRVAATEGAGSEMVRGWFPFDGGGAIWAQPEAALVLRRAARRSDLRLRALLPAGADGRNALSITCNGREIAHVENRGAELLSIDAVFRLPEGPLGDVGFLLRTARAFRPPGGRDARRLGFALLEAEIERS
ncbi:MAG: SPASM domain-containing protein [Planctomycetes bacterium]|nr:SPASM domain-containing protein [Planctomycetota bacterium]